MRRAAKIDAKTANRAAAKRYYWKNRPKDRKTPAEKYTGARFGRLVITEYRRGAGRVKATAVVACDCGSVKTVAIAALIAGLTTSCGCLKREKTVAMSTTHGRSNTPEHNSWAGMKRRCSNPAAQNFRWYGAKGVKVCDRWRDDFAAFLADMGPKPSPQHSIDRINPFGDYEPGNCRWATKREQAQNQRRRHVAKG